MITKIKMILMIYFYVQTTFNKGTVFMCQIQRPIFIKNNDGTHINYYIKYRDFACFIKTSTKKTYN